MTASRLLRPLLAIVACAALLGGAQVASADRQDDYLAVAADYYPDERITPCGFTRPQLVNALEVANESLDVGYYGTAFQDAIRAEIARIDRGGCNAAVKPPANNPAEDIFGKGARLKIGKVKLRGGPAKERVIVRNTGTVAVGVRGLRITTRAKRRVVLPRYTLRPGRTLRVVAGCGRGERKRRVRATFFACRKKQLLANRNELVQLRKGRQVLSQRGFGRFRGAARF